VLADMRSPPDWGLVYTTVEFIKYCVCFIGPRLFIDWQAVESSPRYRIPLIKDPENGSVGAIVLGKERGPFRLPHGRNWPRGVARKRCALFCNFCWGKRKNRLREVSRRPDFNKIPRSESRHAIHSEDFHLS
jgi:hypothetical protein